MTKEEEKEKNIMEIINKNLNDSFDEALAENPDCKDALRIMNVMLSKSIDKTAELLHMDAAQKARYIDIFLDNLNSRKKNK